MAIDLAALAKFDTPTISNTIELFEVRPRTAGYMDGRIRACFPEMPPAVGYAATATMRCAEPRQEGDVYGSLDEQVARFGELAGPAMVVFQDLDDPPVAATFGEIMCTTYRAFGAAGLITSGGARDLDQVRRLGFPAFSNGAICSHGYSHIVNLHRAGRFDTRRHERSGDDSTGDRRPGGRRRGAVHGGGSHPVGLSEDWRARSAGLRRSTPWHDGRARRAFPPPAEVR
jgi:regulator of RNase E activity RraA